jgi:hypothetical protein
MSQASSILVSSGDKKVLAAALKDVAPDAPAPTIAAPPAVTVTVKTALVADSGVAVPQPSANDLNTQLSNSLGTVVEVDVAEREEETETSATGFLPEGSASGAPRLVPLLSAPLAGLAAVLTAALCAAS